MTPRQGRGVLIIWQTFAKERGKRKPNSFLTFRQSRWGNVVLIPESIALLEDLELLTQETAEGWSYHSTFEGSLRQAADEEVNVINVLEKIYISIVIQKYEINLGNQAGVKIQNFSSRVKRRPNRS